MKYFYIEPAVDGGLGSNTIADRSTHPPRIDRLQYEFDDWCGDALLESFPCIIATEVAAGALKAAAVTGVEFAKVEVTTSDLFRHLQPNLKLPPFVWLRVNGVAGTDDFGLAPDRRFVLSARALDVIRPFGLSHAEIEPFKAPV